MTKNWIAVASANHVQQGQAGGFMQVCHGKAAPLRRIKPGDQVVYYSPTAEFGSKLPLRQFTALGIVKDGEPYPFDMGNGFIPHRRDILWLPARSLPIHPLLGQLEFSAGIRNWAYPLRFGILSISQHDMSIISASMGINLKKGSLP